MTPLRYDRRTSALAGRDSHALDSGSWGAERPLSPGVVSYATDSGRQLVAAVTRAPDQQRKFLALGR